MSNTPLQSLDSKPLISVVVPVYNVERYLDRCVSSILNQTYKNLEIILIDDGSKDGSWGICQKLRAGDSRIVIKKQSNAGSSVARNAGLELAKGDFIAFVDSDDYIDENMLLSMYSFAEKHQLEVVECGFMSSSDLNKPYHSKYDKSFVETRDDAMFRVIRDNNFSVWRRIYKRETVIDLRFIPGKIHQDVFFTIDVIHKIDRQGYLPMPLYVYNNENESVIRSPYTLKKLDAKDALYHIVEVTGDYSKGVKVLANEYLLRGLVNHLNALVTHPHLDKSKKHRLELRREIASQMKNMDLRRNKATYQAVLIRNLPLWLYGLIFKLNELRIKIKQTFLQTRDVPPGEND